MSQTTITLAFEQWKAQQTATGEPVLLDEFVFALVPDLDPDLPVDRSETLPPVAQIVHREPVTRKGVVNENAVVHSAVLGADVGDFSFNWIGLTNRASGMLAMIVHAPEQQKLKTKEGQQGNVLTRSFLMEFNGAQTETAINTPAETWQIDFTARMAGMDERQRMENTDIYGAAAFFDDGWLVGKTGNQFFVTRGAGYVAGLRTELAADQNITVTTKPVSVWLDVCWTGSLTGVRNVQSKVTVAGTLEDYEKSGIQHYVFALADIDVDGNIIDLRPGASLNSREAADALKKHEQSRNHPDASLTAKGFVQLSSAVSSSEETKAATPKAVKVVNDNANNRLEKNQNLSDLSSISEARHNLELGKLATKDSLSSSDVGAFPAKGGAVGDDGVSSPFIHVNDKSESVKKEGIFLLWNESGNQGEGNIVVNKGSGTGGFKIRCVNNDGVNELWSFAINQDGNLLEKGTRLYGPNNKPSPPDIGAIGADSCIAAGFASGDVTFPYMRFTPTSEVIALALRPTASLGSGWWKDPNTGLIIQWGGGATQSSGTESRSFNIAFPNVAAVVFATMGVGVNSGNTIFAQVANNQGFNYKGSGSTMGFSWMAIGW